MLLTQSKYILDLLKDAKLEDANVVHTPLPSGFIPTQSSKQLENLDQYRRLIERFLYLNFTRPDISFATQHLSQFMSKLTEIHLNVAMHLLKYLKGSQEYGLFYPVQNNFRLTAYSDADWATCKETRRSITSYCTYIGSSLIAWKTKKHNTVSRSSAKAAWPQQPMN